MHGSFIVFTSIHYDDVIMTTLASQITTLTVVYSIVYSGVDQRKSKLRVTGLCAGNSPGTGEFPAQMASYAENVSIWWRHHDKAIICLDCRVGGLVPCWPGWHLNKSLSRRSDRNCTYIMLKHNLSIYIFEISSKVALGWTPRDIIAARSASV